MPVDPRNPAPYCHACLEDLHALCDGWVDGFCCCALAECLTDLTEPEGDP